jgi:predicted acetyltransferase
MIRIEAASLTPPRGLSDLLADLGDGENGFMGTPVHTGEATQEEYLQRCCDMPDPAKLKPGLVPQTVFWVLDADGEAVGIVRLRHYLIDKLRVHGGHCGYYMRSDQRGKGHGKALLALALDELRRLGETQALITTDPDNIASIRVIEFNGGQFADESTDPETGAQYRRYWIDLQPQQDASTVRV